MRNLRAVFQRARTVHACLLLAGLAVSATSPSARAQCHFREDKAAQELTYRFATETSGDALVLHVTLEFRLGPDGTSELRVPAGWAAESLHGVRNMHVVTPGATFADGEDDTSKFVHGKPRQMVSVAYDVKKDWTGPMVHPIQFHALILPEYVEFTGSSALAAPRIPNEAPVIANFDWQKLPAAWTVATSFGASADAAGRCQTHTGKWSEVQYGLYAAGDYRLHSFKIGTRDAVLAARGTWTFSDELAIAQLQRVVGAVRDFWHDDNFPYFLVTLAPYDRDHGSSDGSAFTNAFWMFLSKQDSFSTMLPQLAHEAVHAWNPGKMGPYPGSDKPTQWFSEGFTDYYGHLLVYRSGEVSASAYVDSLNRTLKRFSSTDDPYTRGRIIALWLDAALRTNSGGKRSLDEAMFAMVRSGDKPLTQERIFQTISDGLTEQQQTTLRKAVLDHGELLPPAQPPPMKACVRLAEVESSPYLLGLDLTKSKVTRRVTDVAPNGPAYAAGLRDGMNLIGWSVVDDPDRKATFKVRSPDGDKTYEYFPRGNPVKSWLYRIESDGPCVTP